MLSCCPLLLPAAAARPSNPSAALLLAAVMLAPVLLVQVRRALAPIVARNKARRDGTSAYAAMQQARQRSAGWGDGLGGWGAWWRWVARVGR